MNFIREDIDLSLSTLQELEPTLRRLRVEDPREKWDDEGATGESAEQVWARNNRNLVLRAGRAIQVVGSKARAAFVRPEELAEANSFRPLVSDVWTRLSHHGSPVLFPAHLRP